MRKRLAIETGIEEEYEQALITSAKKIGWEVMEVMHIPFGDSFVYKKNGVVGDPVTKEDLDDPDVWYHGSISGGKAAQRVAGWHVHANWAKLRCSNYYEQLNDVILQENYKFSTLEALPLEKDDLFESDLSVDGTIFLRPDSNGKEFNGGCISKDTWDEQFELVTFYDPPPDTKVVLAKPQKIEAEARFLIVDGCVVTGSLYKSGGHSLRMKAFDSLFKNAEEIARYCKDKWFAPSPSWVLDLAKVNGEWKLIEVGATSCCGLYKCDTDAFMIALDGVIEWV